ncbi:unnamed protein product [Agarophyton chilense]
MLAQRHDDLSGIIREGLIGFASANLATVVGHLRDATTVSKLRKGDFYYQSAQLHVTAEMTMSEDLRSQARHVNVIDKGFFIRTSYGPLCVRKQMFAGGDKAFAHAIEILLTSRIIYYVAMALTFAMSSRNNEPVTFTDVTVRCVVTL